jgi:hypothetical protein
MGSLVTPERFWNAFVHELSSKLSQDALWRGIDLSDTAWTSIMMDVLTSTGETLGYREPGTIGREYFRLDMAFYSYPRRPTDGSDLLWNLEVAIEHENHSETWFDEWIKLAHVRSGLRVLIAYHDYREGRPSVDSKVKEALELYKGLSYAAPSLESFLLILGPAWPTRAENRRRAWKGYTFKGTTPIPQFEALAFSPST